MEIEVELTARPIAPTRGLPKHLAGVAGAIVEFSGMVRATEGGQPIAALEYEAYQPMATRLLRQILEDLGRRHPCLFVRLRHRLGVVPVGEAAIHILVAAPRRAEGFALLQELLDRLKQDVPIWKRPAPGRKRAPISGKSGSLT
jgi:molybdopterin synthase catalytic subunit